MDVLTLSRLQFAMTSMFHFMFVPLTLGLSVLVAWMEWRYVKTGDETWLRMAKYWGRLFLINFALGVVTGITLEFQFGMNWAEYSKYVGDIFGAPLAIEATAAFFLESVFIGVWIFGWDRVSRKMHAMAITIVAFATNLSALWILLANGWMQHPVGATVSRFTGNPLITERAEMSSFIAVVTNHYGWIKFFHTVIAGYTVAAFFVMGIAAWHLLRKNETDLFKRSFKAAAMFGLVSAVAVVGIGDIHGADVARLQPTKIAAMEAVWETTPGGTGFPLLAIPDDTGERNMLESLVIPKLASLLSYRDPNKPIIGLKEFPKGERPPVALTFFSFRLMVGIGFLMVLLLMYAAWLSWKDRLESAPAFLRILPWAIALPYIAGQLGWVVAEVGRQPWIVYGLLKTSDAVSRSIDPAQVVFSLALFTALYSLLGTADFYLLYKYARKGPDAAVRGPGSTAGEV
jgi:cytochrome d ubiquinol oxidase subunit I